MLMNFLEDQCNWYIDFLISFVFFLRVFSGTHNDFDYDDKKTREFYDITQVFLNLSVNSFISITCCPKNLWQKLFVDPLPVT